MDQGKSTNIKEPLAERTIQCPDRIVCLLGVLI